MSEVKRYYGSIAMCSPTGDLYPGNTNYVLASDYDAAQAELAALREELAKVNREKNDVAYRANDTAEKLNSMTISKATMRNQLKQKLAQTKQRLTAAEQRNAELEALLREAIRPLEKHFSTKAWDVAAKIKRKIKPTESGATHE